jgi:hypothetical protein
MARMAQSEPAVPRRAADPGESAGRGRPSFDCRDFPNGHYRKLEAVDGEPSRAWAMKSSAARTLARSAGPPRHTRTASGTAAPASLRLCLLLNFGKPRLEIKRVIRGL